jgi:hypothetical protein
MDGEMLNKVRNYTGAFRTKLDAGCITNEPQLVATVTEARIKVAYYCRDLARLPNDEIEEPAAAVREGSIRQSGICSRNAPSAPRRRQPYALNLNARPEWHGYRQCSY